MTPVQLMNVALWLPPGIVIALNTAGAEAVLMKRLVDLDDSTASHMEESDNCPPLPLLPPQPLLCWVQS